ncbi:MAG: bifunctional folylpolyglutamate synthase/dihydrofolate synthase [Kiritimatiellia bacterium]
MATEEALQRLFRRHRFGIKLGLHVEQALLERLGHPERAYGSIHVTGTNGKGSVCAMIASVLGALHGPAVGLYTSPHLVRFHERIQVNGKNIPDADLDPLLTEIEKVAARVAVEVGQEPTFFECATAMAFEYFRRRGVKLAVIEVGMGGRLDATNVIVPLLSVITDISLEHTAYLGTTLEAIAAEKAGIVKEGRPVVVGDLPPEADDVIRAIAQEKHSPVLCAQEQIAVRLRSMDLSGLHLDISSPKRSLGNVHLPLTGLFQLNNVGVALSAIEVLEGVLGISFEDDALRAGLEHAVWPARCQVLEKDPPVILDGAHNPGAARALAETLRKILKRRKLALVFGMCADKDVQGFLRHFGGMTRILWVVPIPNERNMAPERIEEAARALGWETRRGSIPDALAEATAWARAGNAAVCICGSLYLAGEVLKLRETQSGG